MLDPHELINLPGYGSAEKELRKARMWRLTEEEKMQERYEDMVGALEEIEGIAWRAQP